MEIDLKANDQQNQYKSNCYIRFTKIQGISDPKSFWNENPWVLSIAIKHTPFVITGITGRVI